MASHWTKRYIVRSCLTTLPLAKCQNIGLPENRFLRNRNGIPYDIIHGTFFLAQGNGESFCSLTDKQIQTYTRLYSHEKLFVMQHGKVINQPKKGKSTHER